jgi:hypothetical protein
MGYSFTTFDDLTVHLLRQIGAKNILDIGAGNGKYGRLVRTNGLEDIKLVAVEYDETKRDHLLSIGYDEVRCISAMDLMKDPTEIFEVVILGDVIEHMRKSEGQDLLEYLNYRSAYIFVVTPENMTMNASEFYEGHNSLWLPSSMRWHDLWAHSRNRMMHFYLLRGMLPGSRAALYNLVHEANAQEFMNLQTSPDQDGRPRRLTLHDDRSYDLDPTDSNSHLIYRVN